MRHSVLTSIFVMEELIVVKRRVDGSKDDRW